MRSFINTIAIIAFVSAMSAYADPHSISMESCEQAIADRLGMSTEDTQLTLESIKSNGRYKDYRFAVKTATGGYRGAAECHARPSGKVSALDMWGDLPISQASS
jgi:hypothetical protein